MNKPKEQDNTKIMIIIEGGGLASHEFYIKQKKNTKDNRVLQ